MVPRPVGQQYVLVVEDDPELRGLYRSALTTAGFTVVAVEDGLDALRQIEQQKPIAVVLDLDLRHVAGQDVHQDLKANPDTRNIPIIVATGADVSDLDPAELACLLRKPFSVDELIVAVENCLNRVYGAD